MSICLNVQLKCKTQINNALKYKNVLLKQYEEIKSREIKRKREEKISKLNEAIAVV